VVWVLVERRVAEPLVDLKLFRLRPYDGALTANLTMNMAFAGLSYLLVLWLENARGYGPVAAGTLMLPATIGIFALIPVGGRMDAHYGGRRPVLIGLIVMSVGLAVLGVLNADTTIVLISVALVVIGVGLGLLSTPISNTAVGDVPESLAGTAAGVFKMSSMVGGALGVALLSAFARGFTVADSSNAVASVGLTQDQVDEAHNALVNSASFDDALSTLDDDLGRKVTQAVVDAFSTGLGHTMIATAILSLAITVVVAFVWPRRTAKTLSTTDSGEDPGR
jgi:MFS family permease